MQDMSWLVVSLFLCLFQVSGTAQSTDLDDVLAGFAQSAEDSLPIDDILSGFDEPPLVSDSTAEETTYGAEWLDVGGDLGISTVLNFAHKAPSTGQIDHRGVSGLKSWVRLEARINLPCS